MWPTGLACDQPADQSGSGGCCVKADSGRENGRGGVASINSANRALSPDFATRLSSLSASAGLLRFVTVKIKLLCGARAAGFVSFLLLCGLLSPPAQGFSLLGPYAEWMTPELGYRTAWEAGGPVPLGEEYRWNIPVVTYAFDQSFLEYFGSNGVAAVESAFAILNALPRASEMVLTNFPLLTIRVNYRAESMLLMDLKSRTLCALLQEMGLADPYANMYRLRRWDPTLPTLRVSLWKLIEEGKWPSETVPNIIQKLNFDPETLAATNSHNSVLFVPSVFFLAVDPITGVPEFASTFVEPLDGTEFRSSTISMFGNAEQGKLSTGLTRDEVGGLRYLYSSNNINPEILLAGVRGSGSNASSYVDRALRPGIEKVKFVRVDYESLLDRLPVPVTNTFVDTYIVEGAVKQQQLERVISQPDIIFEVADLYDPRAGVSPNGLGIRRTGADAWLKTSADPEARGPGIIRPGIRLAYHRCSPEVYGFGELQDVRWGSFEATAALPIVYPVTTPVADTNVQVRLKLWSYSPRRDEQLGGTEWIVPVSPEGTVQLQTSTNLISWDGITVTNQGIPINWFWLHLYPSESLGPEAFPTRFFRVKPN